MAWRRRYELQTDAQILSSALSVTGKHGTWQVAIALLGILGVMEFYSRIHAREMGFL